MDGCTRHAHFSHKADRGTTEVSTLKVGFLEDTGSPISRVKSTRNRAKIREVRLFPSCDHYLTQRVRLPLRLEPQCSIFGTKLNCQAAKKKLPSTISSNL